MESWIEWARGPAFRLALALLLLGLLRHVLLTVIGVREAMRKAGDKVLPGKRIRAAVLSWLFPVKRLGTRTVFSTASVIFHLGALLTPLFLLTHVVLVRESIGLSWPTLPPLGADLLTLAALLGLAVMLAIRVASRPVRVLSRFGDYALLVLTALPFLTGFLLAHPAWNPIPFGPAMLLHVLSADLLMALIPFTKLVHIALLPATQLVSEVGWHFIPDAGEQVARTLGKENQPI